MHRAFAMALLLAGWQEEKTGKILITFEDGVPKEIEVFSADDAVQDALENAWHLQFGPFSNTFDTPLVKAARTTEKESVMLTLKPGLYHVRLKVADRTAVWLAKLKVTADATLEQKVKVGALGSLKGTWTLDKSAQEGKTEKLESLNASLVRDGKVWARVGSATGKTFEIKDVPPGTYALVLESLFEEFVWVVDEVKIEEGKAATVKAAVKRENMGGFVVQFTDKKTGRNTHVPKDVVLVDGKGRFALKPNHFFDSEESKRVGWFHIPVDGNYIVRSRGFGYAPSERKSLAAKSPTIQRTERVYEIMKVALIQSK